MTSSTRGLQKDGRGLSGLGNLYTSQRSTVGKVDTLLNKKLEDVEWGEFKIGNLFEKIKTKKLPFKADELPKQVKGKYVLPCLTSSFQNQGLNYFAPKAGATVLKNVISIPSNSDVYRAYFQSNEFTVLSDAYAIKWTYNQVELSPNQYLFAVQCINKITDLPIYSYKNKLGGWNVVKNKYIQLPMKNKNIDFDFMENIISEIEAEKISKLRAYLEENGLDDYSLTSKERDVLEGFENGKIIFSDFKLGDLFDIKNNPQLNKDSFNFSKNGKYPYFTRTVFNNGIFGYVDYLDEEHKVQGNCLAIGMMGMQFFYMEKEFYAGQFTKRAIPKLFSLNKKLAHYFTSIMNKKRDFFNNLSVRQFERAFNDSEIELPIKNNQPDYEIMETLISAVQKLVIKDVVEYVRNRA